MYESLFTRKSSLVSVPETSLWGRSSFVLPLSVVTDNDSCVAYSLGSTIAVVLKAEGSSAFLYEQVMKDFERRRQPILEGFESDSCSSKLNQR